MSGRWLRPLPMDRSVPHMPEWTWIHTPGHTPGHVSLWRASDRCIIAGDAFITTKQESAYAVATQRPELHGPPAYFTQDWEASRRSVEELEFRYSGSTGRRQIRRQSCHPGGRHCL